MILVTHPVGSTMLRQSLQALLEEDLLAFFSTTLGWSSESQFFKKIFFRSLKKALKRRVYPVPIKKLCTTSSREVLRLLAQQLKGLPFTKSLQSKVSYDKVCWSHDQFTARLVKQHAPSLQASYAYEDGALNTFLASKEVGIKCIYELPIAYWQFSHKLLKEEAERLPAWKDTLIGLTDSSEKLHRKAAELELADCVICPSRFVYNTLPKHEANKGMIIPYGAPIVIEQKCKISGKLRFLFAGALSQRKGLADLFEAIKLLKAREAVEWVIFGPLVQSLDFYRNQYRHFTYEAPRSNDEVIELMLTCDVLVLPSIIEGRAIVQLEALACGLPLIITAHTGGDDLVQEGITGFVVPIRSPSAIAEKLQWFIDHQHLLPFMSMACRKKAREVSWDAFRRQLVINMKRILGHPQALHAC